MNSNASVSYVVDTAEQIPLHLKGRAPFVLPNTEAIFRRPEAEVLDDQGRVLMAGAIEFQTQITPGILTDVCDPDEIYDAGMRVTHRFRCVYDPEIQRGVKETSSGKKEFLRPSEIEAMVQDIDQNRFECPQLMWNLRAGETTWVYVRDVRELRIYEGVATRPDTNHRHHAITRVHRRYLQWVRDTGSTQMGDYNPHRAYGLVMYTDDFQGEGHRFYVYNFLGWRVSTSTAHFIESKTATPHLHSRLARELMEHSAVLSSANVEVMTNHLSGNSAKMVTFGTLVEALRGGFPNLTEENYEAIRDYMLDFLGKLGAVRPREIGLLSVAQRQRIRLASVADQAVLWHAYFRLAARLRDEGTNLEQALKALAGPHTGGDLFSRDNQIWARVGVIVPGKRGPRVVNNRQARQGAFEMLCELVGIPPRAMAPEISLEDLAMAPEISIADL